MHIISSGLIYSRRGSMGFTVVAITAEGLKDKPGSDNHSVHTEQHRPQREP